MGSDWVPMGSRLGPMWSDFIGCACLSESGTSCSLLVFKAVHDTAPEYLSELCRSNAEDTARSRLRSAAHGDLQVDGNAIIDDRTVSCFIK